ncbi:hypothetical protein [Vulcanisaeta distributa]|uniref:Uncharacterized protein n=1 Tax=Vulcanisaeta distributa (strain DSM 14429 / JCM 11212 / NBRC 100878 / IC-017) TaxID=572478 RepID=E1QRG7_VULDI|nr:hypothetical protein [Vulcanisaeta distributa]ADN51781.1 conserved hypothetical protein [Vulcanisaeta distributa DSM 14429]
MGGYVDKDFITEYQCHIVLSVLMLALTIPMIIIHTTVALISLRYLVIPRSVGLPIAIYESTYYVLLLTYLLINHYSIALLGLTVLFLVIHVGGTYLYMRGALSYLSRNRSNLRRYGYYEIAELMFIIVVIGLLVH